MRNIQFGVWNTFNQAETFFCQFCSLLPLNIHQDVSATFQQQQSPAECTDLAVLNDVEDFGQDDLQHPALLLSGGLQLTEQFLQLILGPLGLG